MKNHRIVALNVVICLLVAFGSRAFSRDDKKLDATKAPEAPKMPDMAQMMKKWKDSITPNENHKRLDAFVGSWNVTFRMIEPGMPPMETKGTAEVKWVMDGLYIMEEMNAEMLMPDANMQMKKIPYKGIGFTGYDNAKNLYTGCWISNLSSELLTMAGTWPPGASSFSSYGKMDEPMLDMHGRTVKYKTTINDDKKHTFEIFDLAAGENHKVIEIVYERK